MDVIARRAFERPDVEANRAGGNPRQLGTRLAYGAEWSLDDHDASPSRSGGSVTELSVTDRYRGGGDGASMEPSRSPPLVKIAHFRKANTTLMSRRPRAYQSSRLVGPPLPAALLLASVQLRSELYLAVFNIIQTARLTRT
jgi:hypothetical protein